jgi:hypothetical protein
MLAMNAVRAAEEARGCHVVDVTRENCGWDFTSYAPGVNGKPPVSRHIEVKGRTKEATSITISRNEILYALNQSDKFILAIVLVNTDGTVDGPHYVRKPFTREPDWSECSSNHDLNKLLSIATRE